MKQKQVKWLPMSKVYNLYRLQYEILGRKGQRTYTEKTEAKVRRRFLKDYGKEEDGYYILSIIKY